jgi:peptidyl-dipeptidase A
MTKAEIEQAQKLEAAATKPETKRTIALLKLSATLPAPKDRAKLAEMTDLATKLDGGYGSAKYCKDEKDPSTCRDIGQLEEVLTDKKRDYDAQLDAWRGWHDTAAGARKDYQRIVELVNEGSRELGYKDTGEFWRAGYDMSPAEFAAETDRLWGQVKPLYEQLQCYTRKKLVDKYGDKGQINGMIPAHLTGNMWAQAWGEIWDLLQPYPAASNLDVTSALKKERDAQYKALVGKASGAPDAEALFALGRQADLEFAKQSMRRTEDFYKSIGFPPLPASFYERAQFIKPLDREVVCHASAWDMNLAGDVRLKMCIKPNEEDFRTAYHEMGHVYYYLAYNNLPILFQNGAHDGFHEAIGDTIQLSLTPGYLKTVAWSAK